jgi:putative transposase
MDLQSFAHGYGQLSFHIVTAPKYRYDIFGDPEIRDACEQIFHEIAKQYGFFIYELKVMPDHLHLFVGFKPCFSVSDVLQRFKGISARRLFEMFPQLRKRLWKGHLWSRGKFVRSVGNVTADTIKHYMPTHKASGKRPFGSMSLAIRPNTGRLLASLPVSRHLFTGKQR